MFTSILDGMEISDTYCFPRAPTKRLQPSPWSKPMPLNVKILITITCLLRNQASGNPPSFTAIFIARMNSINKATVRGFTLIELLIVITIIGILMAIVGTAGFGLLTDAEEQKT